MKISIPRERGPLERRVALTPEACGKLVKVGAEVRVEAGAGERAFFPDSAYSEAGAKIVADPAALLGDADLVLMVGAPGSGDSLTDLAGPGAPRMTAREEIGMIREGATLVAFLEPLFRPELARLLAERKITSFSMDLVPRTTRAQKMDVLSSMATVAGYHAVLLGASVLPRFFPMFVTAAGTIAPAKVLVLGAGVAGLQAIATARRLGAVVEAYDVRPAVKEEVESLGAKFIELDLGAADTQDAGGYAKVLADDTHRREMELLVPVVARADFVVTTARVPGIRAPLLVTEKMVHGMKPGSVIVDMAADTGGNCALTRANETVVSHGVTILGPTDLATRLPIHASQMYAKNLMNFLELILKDGALRLNFEDDIVRDTCVTHEGKIQHQRTRERVERAPQPATAQGS